MNTTLNNSNRRHQLSISVLNDIDTYDGKQGHKLDNWLADIKNAATLVEEDEVRVAKGKARGLARDLIKEHEDKPWLHIKEQLRNCLNNASIIPTPRDSWKSNRRHQLSISVLNDIDTYDGKQGHKLDNWLADIKNAATLVEEDEVRVAKRKARGLARDLIKEHEDKPWLHIKEQLRNCLNNASIIPTPRDSWKSNRKTLKH